MNSGAFKEFFDVKLQPSALNASTQDKTPQKPKRRFKGDGSEPNVLQLHESSRREEDEFNELKELQPSAELSQSESLAQPGNIYKRIKKPALQKGAQSSGA